MNFFDLHNDFPTCIGVDGYAKYLSACDGTVTAAIWTSEFDSETATDRVRAITRALSETEKPPPIAIEDLGCLTNSEELDFSDYFYCTLTWNHNNRFAGGALDDGVLTDAGKRIIGAMNGACAVDLAHLNRKSFFEVIDKAARPMCSHTGFNSHPRSIDAEQIKALLARSGIIGLSAVITFTDAHSAVALAETIDRFVSSYGIDGLCLGTDFYGSDRLPEDFRTYSDFDMLACELARMGYGKADTDKIFYKNAKQFYEEILHERHL